MLTMLATLCHMATVSPGMPPIEFCQEQVIAQRDDTDEKDKEAMKEAAGACYVVAQQMIAPRLMPGYTVKEIWCIKGDEKPKNSI